MILEGRSAVVTGGGRGIGAAVARALVAAGAAVLVAARTAEQAEAVAAELVEAGHRAYAATCDVTDPGLPREKAEAAILATSLQKRLLEPAEVAYLVVALCHPLAKGVNGQALVVDGGSLLA